MTRIALGNARPVVAAGSWVAASAVLVGSVELARDASAWYFSVLRGDGDRIAVGERSNVQDGCVLHADPGHPVLVGSGVSVGHRAVLHGCVVEDGVLVGMGAMVLNGAHIGAGSLIAAGAVVLEGTRVPPGSLVAGVPGRVRRPTTDEERASIEQNSCAYVALARRHAVAVDG